MPSKPHPANREKKKTNKLKKEREGESYLPPTPRTPACMVIRSIKAADLGSTL